MSRVLVLVGTQKGAFLLWSDAERRQWEVEGPLLRGWEVTTLAWDSRTAAIWGGVSSYVYGATVHVSRDLGKSWEQVEKGPAYGEEAGRRLERIWTVVPGRADEPGLLWAGVAEAGLFRSEDGGETWSGVPGLNDHPTREEWSPGAGGMCCHTLVRDPVDARRMWAGISAVGVFRSDDDGATWTPRNEGVPRVSPSEKFPEIGSCVHKIVVSPVVPDLLYQQNHAGVFRSRDGADSWERIEQGVPCSFGFPMVMHPHDPDTLFVIPQESDEYRFFPQSRAAVYRTRDGGDSWHALTAGLPEEPVVQGVLRGAMATDSLASCGVYFGTTGGEVFYSADAGESWARMPCRLPRISSVAAVVLD